MLSCCRLQFQISGEFKWMQDDAWFRQGINPWFGGPELIHRCPFPPVGSFPVMDVKFVITQLFNDANYRFFIPIGQQNSHKFSSGKAFQETVHTFHRIFSFSSGTDIINKGKPVLRQWQLKPLCKLSTKDQTLLLEKVRLWFKWYLPLKHTCTM